MPAKQSSPAQDIEWLTPTPSGRTVELPWPDAEGPLLLTCHLARVDGRVLLVGVDVRSFGADAGPGPQGLVEVNHPVLRSLRAGEIADAARAKLAAELASEARSRRGSSADREKASQAYSVLTSPAAPNPTGQRPASAQLETVASLYNASIAAGGDQARRPAIYVHQALSEQGMNISINAVRGQIHRARVKGLISSQGD